VLHYTVKLLLHACCADCVLKFIESAKADNFDEVVVYYYNPNIHPRSEYLTRLKAIQEVLLPLNIKIVVADYSPKDYFQVVANPARPSRCVACWNLRLSKTADYAVKNGYTHFSSTLVTSEYQDHNTIQKIGESLALKNNLTFYLPKTICCDLKTTGFYKQFFCGCVYSLTERYQEKYS